MSDQHSDFHNRIRRLGQKHAQGVHGVAARMRDDGLIVIEPRRPARSQRSGRSLILFFCAVLLFKGFLIASLGFNSYALRVETLREGSVIERGGAFIMYPDPLSLAIAERLMPILR